MMIITSAVMMFVVKLINIIKQKIVLNVLTLMIPLQIVLKLL